jgi:hypothetical protein
LKVRGLTDISRRRKPPVSCQKKPVAPEGVEMHNTIVGGAVLGLIFVHEPLTLRTSLGILLAIASIYLIAGNPKP